MVAIAQAAAGPTPRVRGVTVVRGPRMITTILDLDAAVAEVIAIGVRKSTDCSGVIVAAFGDPGVAELRRCLTIPVIGLCEAAMTEAAAGGRRFAVATTTPMLVSHIDASALRLGFGQLYAGTWLTSETSLDFVNDPRRLESALADVTGICVRAGDAQAVIIGGGPLSRAAAALSDRFAVPVISPVAAAVRHLTRRPIEIR